MMPNSVVASFFAIASMLIIGLTLEIAMPGNFWSPILFWVGAILFCLPIVGMIVLFSRMSSKEWGTKFLYEDMKYLGYEIGAEQIPSPSGSGFYTENFIKSSQAGSLRAKPLNRVIAWLAYRSDILAFLQKISEKNHPSTKRTKEGKISENSTYYIEYGLRKEVYDAIALEKKIKKTGSAVSAIDAQLPVASYLFADPNLYQGKSIQNKRLDFLRKNNYPLDTIYQIKNIPTEELVNFDGVAPSFVLRALLSSTNED